MHTVPYNIILYYSILYYTIYSIKISAFPDMVHMALLNNQFSHFCHISFYIISPHFNCSTTTDPIDKVNHKYNSRHIGKVEKTLSDRVSPPHPFSVDTHSKWAADKRVISVQSGKCRGRRGKKKTIYAMFFNPGWRRSSRGCNTCRALLSADRQAGREVGMLAGLKLRGNVCCQHV